MDTAALAPSRSLALTPLQLWVAGVSLVGLAAVVASIWLAPQPSPYLLLLLAPAIVAEVFPVPLDGIAAGNTSFASVFVVSAGVLYGWQYGCLIGATAMLVCELTKRARLQRLAFNASLYALAGLAAGAAAGNVDLHYRAAVVGMAAFYLVDVGLLCVVVSLSSERSIGMVVREYVPETLLPAALMGAQVVLTVLLWRREGPLFLFLTLPTLAAIVYWQHSAHQTLEQRRRLDEMKDEFIAVMSHEIRTPLAIIYGGLKTLRRPELPAGTEELLIETMARESVRLSNIVEDLLYVNRVDRQPELRPEPLDLAVLCRSAAAGVAEYAPAEISFDLAGLEAASALGHSDSVARILVNLVDNAVKYSPGGGTVRLRTCELGNSALVEVADGGVGIPASEREAVFEKFHRLHPNETGGTGLGLYICRELARLMGGEITIEGNRPRGTRVLLRLPLEGGES